MVDHPWATTMNDDDEPQRPRRRSNSKSATDATDTRVKTTMKTTVTIDFTRNTSIMTNNAMTRKIGWLGDNGVCDTIEFNYF